MFDFCRGRAQLSSLFGTGETTVFSFMDETVIPLQVGHNQIERGIMDVMNGGVCCVGEL